MLVSWKGPNRVNLPMQTFSASRSNELVNLFLQALVANFQKAAENRETLRNGSDLEHLVYQSIRRLLTPELLEQADNADPRLGSALRTWNEELRQVEEDILSNESSSFQRRLEILSTLPKEVNMVLKTYGKYAHLSLGQEPHFIGGDIEHSVTIEGIEFLTLDRITVSKNVVGDSCTIIVPGAEGEIQRSEIVFFPRKPCIDSIDDLKTVLRGEIPLFGAMDENDALSSIIREGIEIARTGAETNDELAFVDFILKYRAQVNMIALLPTLHMFWYAHRAYLEDNSVVDPEKLDRMSFITELCEQVHNALYRRLLYSGNEDYWRLVECSNNPQLIVTRHGVSMIADPKSASVLAGLAFGPSPSLKLYEASLFLTAATLRLEMQNMSDGNLLKNGLLISTTMTGVNRMLSPTVPELQLRYCASTERLREIAVDELNSMFMALTDKPYGELFNTESIVKHYLDAIGMRY